MGGLLLASNLLMGFVWIRVSPESAFLMSAALSAFAALLLVAFVTEPASSPNALSEEIER